METPIITRSDLVEYLCHKVTEKENEENLFMARTQGRKHAVYLTYPKRPKRMREQRHLEVSRMLEALEDRGLNPITLSNKLQDRDERLQRYRERIQELQDKIRELEGKPEPEPTIEGELREEVTPAAEPLTDEERARQALDELLQGMEFRVSASGHKSEGGS